MKLTAADAERREEKIASLFSSPVRGGISVALGARRKKELVSPARGDIDFMTGKFRFAINIYVAPTGLQ